MNFSIKSEITSCNSLEVFFERYEAGQRDLIITNEYLLTPQLKGKKAPCDCLYQEQYGKGEPSDEMVDAMLKAVEGKSYDRIIAIGGGTVIDIAKLFVFGDGLTCEEIFAKGATLPRKRSLLILPTTCGTGSEATGLSIIGFVRKNTKIGLAAPALFADEAVMIPCLLSTMPYEVFMTSSVDALIHSVESYVSPKANLFTKSFGRTSIELILSGYQKMAARGKDRALPDETDMLDFLTASTMGGIAFGNAGVGAVHALSYPIGGSFHIPHGQSNYMVFAEVFAAYRTLGADLTELEGVMATAMGCCANDVWSKLFSLISGMLPAPSLRSVGADEATCAEMAASVVENQQRLLVNNPVPLTREQIEDIYLKCL